MTLLGCPDPETWETARTAAFFDSVQLRGTELNYPVHKQELLVIILALKKWLHELIGMSLVVKTDRPPQAGELHRSA